MTHFSLFYQIRGYQERNPMSEVISVQQANQFQPGKSAYACGFFSVAELTSMAPPGKPPTKQPQQIINDAERWYTQFNGSNTRDSTYGMEKDQLYTLLTQVGLRYRVLPCTI